MNKMEQNNHTKCQQTLDLNDTTANLMNTLFVCTYYHSLKVKLRQGLSAACFRDIVSKLNDLTQDIRKERDFGVEFDEVQGFYFMVISDMDFVCYE